MSFFFLLPVLACGFIVCHTNPYYYYRLHRYEGQYLYLRSIYLGLICVASGTFLSLLLNKFIPSKFTFFGFVIPVDFIHITSNFIEDTEFCQDRLFVTQLSWGLAITIASVLFSFLWSFLTKIRLWIKAKDVHLYKIILMAKILNDSPLDKLLFESYVFDTYIMLSLDTRKVYVGRVLSLGEPTENKGMDQEISLLPVMSGYRDKETFKLNFTTDYRDINYPIQVVLRQDKILHATEFSFEAYKEFESPVLQLELPWKTN